HGERALAGAARVVAGGRVRDRVRDRRAAQQRSRRGGLPPRTALARGLHAVGQRLVRRPPPARLLGARAGARRAARPASARRARGSARDGAVRRARRRPVRHASDRRALVAPALLLAVLSALASPVAGAFVGLAALAWAGSGWLACRAATAANDSAASAPGATGRRAPSAPIALPAALALAALSPVVLLAVAFPEGGAQPFVSSAFWPALAVVLVFALVLPREQRLLRGGAALYALALIAAYAIPTAGGGNADRLGALFARPLLACALMRPRAAAG